MDTLRSVAESPVLMGVLVSISYSLVYFWRYPIFILPPEVCVDLLECHCALFCFACNPPPLCISYAKIPN